MSTRTASLGNCGQCGQRVEPYLAEYEQAWGDAEVGNQPPNCAYIDAVVTIFHCGHPYIVRKSLWKRSDGGFVFSIGKPTERGTPAREDDPNLPLPMDEDGVRR